jgi:hypothetical protein
MVERKCWRPGCDRPATHRVQWTKGGTVGDAFLQWYCTAHAVEYLSAQPWQAGKPEVNRGDE